MQYLRQNLQVRISWGLITLSRSGHQTPLSRELLLCQVFLCFFIHILPLKLFISQSVRNIFLIHPSWTIRGSYWDFCYLILKLNYLLEAISTCLLIRNFAMRRDVYPNWSLVVWQVVLLVSILNYSCFTYFAWRQDFLWTCFLLEVGMWHIVTSPLEKIMVTWSSEKVLAVTLAPSWFGAANSPLYHLWLNLLCKRLSSLVLLKEFVLVCCCWLVSSLLCAWEKPTRIETYQIQMGFNPEKGKLNNN